MRHTANPVERLESLLESTRELTLSDEHQLAMCLRMAKVQHLCHQLNPDVCEHRWSENLSAREALQLLQTSAVLLSNASQRERATPALVWSIYQCSLAIHHHFGYSPAAV